MKKKIKKRRRWTRRRNCSCFMKRKIRSEEFLNYALTENVCTAFLYIIKPRCTEIIFYVDSSKMYSRKLQE